MNKYQLVNTGGFQTISVDSTEFGDLERSSNDPVFFKHGNEKQGLPWVLKGSGGFQKLDSDYNKGGYGVLGVLPPPDPPT